MFPVTVEKLRAALGRDEAMEIMSNEEFDSITDAMKGAEQQILLNIASSLIDEMEAHTARMVANKCEEHAGSLEADLTFEGWVEPLIKELEPEFDAGERAGRPGGRTYDEEYTPSMEELQDAADARGEPGPLDMVVDRENYGEDVPAEATEADLDYFEIAKGIRAAAETYNAAVVKAYKDAGIVTKSTKAKTGILQIGSIEIESIQLEMKL